MSWTDQDIDGLFRDAAAQKEFRYDATFLKKLSGNCLFIEEESQGFIGC